MPRFSTIPTFMTLTATFLALAACSPKRVTTHPEYATATTPRTESPELPPELPPEPETPPGERATGDADLPSPTPRGQAGTTTETQPTRHPTESLQLGLQAATLAKEQLGKQYQWGAQGPDKFDCSGLVCHVYGNLGVQVPRVSRDQAKTGQEVSRSKLQPGDLVFFSTSGGGINHVGIYVGHNEFVHAPRKHVPVKTDSLNDSYWRQRFKTARRVT